MKYLKHTLILILGAFLATGCYKDLGNYDYSEINQVEFGNFPQEKQYAYRYVNTIHVEPELTGSLAKKDLSNYFLKWVAVVKTGTAENKTTFDLDSNNLNLDYFVRLPEAEYTVYLLVTDRTTNVTWRHGFDLKVTTLLNEGWLVLSEENQCCRLDMISMSGKDELFVKDLWADSPLGRRKGPRKLAHWVDMNAFSDGSHPVYLLSDEGTVQLNPDDFSYDPLNEFRYQFGKWNPDFVPTDLKGTYSNGWRLCTGPNGIYAKEDMMFGAVYGNPLNKLDGESESFGVAPAVGLSAYPYAYNPAVVFYDTTNLRFVQLKSDLQGMRMPTAEEIAFPFRTGRKFVYMTGTLHDVDGEVFTILKDDAGKFWLYGMKVSGNFMVKQIKDHYQPLEIPGIENATAFAIHPILYYLFYAVGNEIHQYDMTSRRHRVLPIDFGEEGILKQLPGEEISMLKFNIFVLSHYSKPAGSESMQYRLIVGSEKTVSSDEPGGQVRMLEIPATMENPATVYRSYSGFGKIKDVLYRERK